MCNGEIFNSTHLIESLNLVVPPGSSDCAVLPAMLDRMSLSEVSRQLDGDFAIVVVHLDTQKVEVSRDPYGVRPLYYASGPEWRGVFSEIKAIPADALEIQQIAPGHVYTFGSSEISKECWHQVPWLKNPYLVSQSTAADALKVSLLAAVEKRLTTVRDLGACLSGGLDSSLVASIAAKILRVRGLPLHTYSIGMEGSPDLFHARLVANHIGSIHHERIVTAEECLASIPEVIKAIETCDITTVRASVGNYLLAKWITQCTPSVKVVLNGDGADEALGGYLYMRSAPTDTAFETEITRLLTEIHLYDVARSERSMAAWGLESRSPFLDRQFISVARGVATHLLRPTDTCMEKSILRSAFTTDVLPESVLWRRKEAFSDGISRAENSWFEMAKAKGETENPTWSAASFTVNPPKTAEAFWYRTIYSHSFPDKAISVTTPAMWMPRFIDATDPSARTLKNYTI
jgi:asparagine synthase (glutamine-hydrolysing)